MVQKPASNILINLLVVLFVSAIVIQSSLLMIHTQELIDARVVDTQTGITTLCINKPPAITVPCNATAKQGQPYTCTLLGSDPDNDSLVFQASFENQSLFTVNALGLINFTPNGSQVGNFTISFIVDDNKDCANSQDSELFNLSVDNINDPPYLAFDLPDVTLSNGQSISAFFLDDYFDDLDGDPLTYNVTYGDDLVVQIYGSSEVIFSHALCEGDDKSYPVVFEAKDPYNASAESNTVTITVSCTKASSSSSSSGGGGGGGGGGSSGSCKADWICLSWLPCLPNGTRWRRCIDDNQCETERYLKGACSYTDGGSCVESWTCSDWAMCQPNGTQMRLCTDKAECGTFKAIPNQVQDCEYIPTCEDQMQNGLETGVDCGGPCLPCGYVEFPAVISVEGVLLNLILALFSSLLLLMLLYIIFRKQLGRLWAKLRWKLSGKAKKLILLDEEHKKELLDRLNLFEKSLGKTDIAPLLTIRSKFFEYALGLHEGFTYEELLKTIPKKQVSQTLGKHLLSLMSHVEMLDRAKSIRLMTQRLLLESLRTLVIATSQYNLEEVKREMKQLQAPEGADTVLKVQFDVLNAFIALQFKRVGPAKVHYLQGLERYHPLSEASRDRVYEDLMRLYNLVTYMGTYLKE